MGAVKIQPDRLLADLDALAAIGDTGDGGNCRLALTDDDAGGRELVVGWMRALGLAVTVDRIGNVVATRAGAEPGLTPVMTGSHIDTVRTGGRYEGTLGVLAGLEVVRALDDAGIRPRRPLAVAFFTDEEGSRFAPDMLGSLVYVGGMPLEDALDVVGVDGAVLGDELERIGWAGDAGWVAASVVTFVRDLAYDLGGHQVGTVGRLDLHPDLVNVVAARATLTVDLRNTDDADLAEAERRLRDHVA